jgi:hypothetical protein
MPAGDRGEVHGMAQSQQFFIEALSARLRELLTAFAEGRDVSPAALYRAEGFAEAGLQLGLCDQQGFQRLLQSLADEILDEESAAGFADGDAPRIRMRMHKAPVYPSTKNEEA